MKKKTSKRKLKARQLWLDERNKRIASIRSGLDKVIKEWFSSSSYDWDYPWEDANEAIKRRTGN